jgi:hypothetical protein
MEQSFSYSISDPEGQTIGYLLINELPLFQIKIVHLYNLDKAFPHVFNDFSMDTDLYNIVKELLVRSGNHRSFLISERKDL